MLNNFTVAKIWSVTQFEIHEVDNVITTRTSQVEKRYA